MAHANGRHDIFHGFNQGRPRKVITLAMGQDALGLGLELIIAFEDLTGLGLRVGEPTRREHIRSCETKHISVAWN